MDAKFEADTKIADSARMYQMQKANFDMEVNARVRTGVSLRSECFRLMDLERKCQPNAPFAPFLFLIPGHMVI